uniref:Uncharacterized protein n=2 Tax=Graphocephala atropunctata TaxID=36148 RepID=A0A1B6MUU8_9HEMI
MGVPQLNSCCCGCSLSTGSKIIGWLSLAGAVLAIFVLSGSLMLISHIEDSPDTPEAKKLKPYIPVLKILFSLLIAVCVIAFVLAVILLKGVYEKKPKYLRFWVITSLVALVLDFGLKILVMFTFEGFINPLQFVSILLSLYYILVVHSLYREMLQDPNVC